MDHIRCLLDRPTPILTGATFKPPNEHGRQDREHLALTEEQAHRIEHRLLEWPDSPLAAQAMQHLFQTDHYSQTMEREVTTRLYALADSQP